MRALVSLCRERLRRAPGARFGTAAVVAIAFGFGMVLAFVQQDGGAAAALDGMLRSATRWMAWVGGGAIALAAAHDRAAVDRRDGIEALAAVRGARGGALHAARALSAMQMIALVIGVPALVLAVVGAGLSGSMPAGLRVLGVGVGLAVFAGAAGVALGGLAAVSGRVAGARGRLVLVALVLVPWALADLAGNARWSIPGALDTFLFLVTGGMA